MWFEIEMGRDYLLNMDKFDWVVTNIPFSKPKQFIPKMANDCIKGVGILCLANSMTATRLHLLKKEYGLYIHSLTVLYIRSWGFGYRTDFYVLTKQPNQFFDIIIK